MKCYGINCRKETPCVICGKPILSGLNKKTCSRECSNKNRLGIKYKENNTRDVVRSQRALKLRLFKERGVKCQKCGYSKYNILQVHHIDKNRQNNSLKNLELLCPNCHYEKHYLES
jgi:5-methylcytosine-specific restriction endonuclease McrA